MISFLKNLEFKKLKAESSKLNRGMTYVELIVVLSIFAVMTSIVLFNYSKYQEQVDIKVLANDIALKIVQAQKSALSGELPPLSQQTQIDSTWKPSYGVYFDPGTNNNFIYFTDLGIWDNIAGHNTQNNSYDSSSCPGSGECLNSITITKGDYILRIDSYLGLTPTQITNPLSITFTRPNSGAAFYSNGLSLPAGFDYVQITISSPSLIKSCIDVYPSGRIQINQCLLAS